MNRLLTVASRSAVSIWLVGAASVVGATLSLAEDPTRIVGPDECAECHKKETAAWQQSHHFTTYRELPRSEEAEKIAAKMGIRRLKSESACLGCHFTEKVINGTTEAIAGITCESCHGAGQEWYKVHSGFSGKKEHQESASEEAVRWQKAEAAGMIRPSMVYTLAKNCFSCHLVPHEELVNRGGHTPGSNFELVAWSQGEVRHNSWYNKGKSNPPAALQRQRMLFIVGRIAELEMALVGVSKATVKADYALKMAQRADKARKVMASLAKLLPTAPELTTIAQIGLNAGLKLNNQDQLRQAATEISVLGLAFAQAYDGSAFGAVDKYLPAPNKFKGQAQN